MAADDLEQRVLVAFAAEQAILGARSDDMKALTDTWTKEAHVERRPFQERLALRWAAQQPDAAPWVGELVDIADANATLARETLASCGWPEHLGESGVFAFAAIIAHADDDQPLRRTACALLMEAATRPGGTPRPRLLAHLVDRAQLVDGEPQVYGSLLVPEEGGPRYLTDIIDPARLDERRARIGLPPADDDAQRYRRGAVAGPFLVPLGGD